MAAELSRLARRVGLGGSYGEPRKVGPGALRMAFSPPLARLCVLYHRTCSRVLWDLYGSRAPRLEPLYEDLRALISAETRGYLRDDFSLSVGVRGAEHFPAGERQIVGTVKNALIDGARERGVRLRVDPQSPDQSFIVQIDADGQVTVSLDLGGRPMNQRGYRVTGAVAPLRENLAAQLVMLARHDPRNEILIDPLAGTGTIAIEAACLAQGLPVWTADRVPTGLSVPELAAAGTGTAVALFPDTQALIFANELDADRAALITTHSERAYVRAQVRVRSGDFRDWSPAHIKQTCSDHGKTTDRGLIVTNPPYGERLADPALRSLYNDFASFCRSFPGFRVAVLVANPDFEQSFGMRPRIKKPVSNGPLRGHFLLYDM